MKKIDLEQGSPEWLQWRRSLLTATDAAMLLGESPYVTPYQGWQRKLGLIPEQEETEPMRRGKRDEPIARGIFNDHFDFMTPCCVQSEKYPFIGASLDGLNESGTLLLEIKSQKPVTEIPILHKIQMYHQMLATDLQVTNGYYVSFWEGINTTFELKYDHAWGDNYLPKAEEYWKRIVLFDPPALMDRDYRFKGDNNAWRELAKRYREVNMRLKFLEEEKAELRKELLALTEDENSEGCGIRVTKKIMKGKIDYFEATEVLNIRDDMLEPFRKPSSCSWMITVEK